MIKSRGINSKKINSKKINSEGINSRVIHSVGGPNLQVILQLLFSKSAAL